MASLTNPIATEDQHRFERLALEVLKHPTLQRARREAAEHWLETLKPSPEMRAAFEWAYDEVVFGAIIWSLNQDPLRPKVVCITRLAHKVGGLEIPGSRWGIDNPDSIYRVIPISGDERYVLRGTVPERRQTENYFTLWDPDMNTVDVFNGKDLVLGAGRSYEITVDAAPANGRPNHVQSSPKAKQFYIRDVMLDWTLDRANTIEVEKLGPPAPAFEPSLDERAEAAAKLLHHYVRSTITWNGYTLVRPANEFSFKMTRDTGGALRNQIYVGGHFNLADDEALVLDVNLGGAEYFIAPITNFFGTTNDILDRTGSMNKAQSLPNPDGSYTFVVSVADPGIHNWVDPSGLHQGVMTLRWAEFPNRLPTDDAGVSSRVVRLDRLQAALPEGTPTANAEQRRAQRAERAAGYAWRLLDH